MVRFFILGSASFLFYLFRFFIRMNKPAPGFPGGASFGFLLCEQHTGGGSGLSIRSGTAPRTPRQLTKPAEAGIMNPDERNRFPLK